MPAKLNHSVMQRETKPGVWAELNPRVTTNSEMRLAELNKGAKMSRGSNAKKRKRAKLNRRGRRARRV